MTHPQEAEIGTFVWYDLRTRAADRAWRFYSEWLGWGRQEADRPGGPYAVIRHATRDLGGIVPIDAEDRLRPHWIGYVSVPDADAAAKAASAAGGRVVLPPTTVEGICRFTVILDPHGAAFSPFHWERRPDPLLPVQAGCFCWSELLTPDPETSARFYEQVLGWTAEPGRPGAYDAYWLFRRGGRALAGMLRRERGADFRPQWLHYLQVEDVEAASSRARALGAALHVPPTDIPDIGRFAVIDDPGGAKVAIFAGNAPR